VTMRVTTTPAATPPGNRVQTCPVCQRTSAARGRQRYCSPACKQAAYRYRHPTPPPASVTAPAPARAAQTIYQCPDCEARYLNLQRCPDCQLFCRRLGAGGPSPCCEELITMEELVPSIDNTPAPKQSNTGAAMP